MDRVRFEVFSDGPYEYVLSREAQFARTIINERSILDIIGEYERTSLEWERGGMYKYQFAGDLYQYLTDKSSRMDDRFICLLICTCFTEGCSPLFAAMEETEYYVIWGNFFNPNICGGDWSGDDPYDIGPFCFDKGEFYHEAENLKRLISG